MKKFFIVGCPRSGTTMVQQALNRHSQIVIPPETKFFFSFLGLSKRAQQDHVARLNRDLNINLDAPKTRVASDEEGRAFFESMAAQYVRRIGKTGAALFGEKTPEHTGHLARIRRVFPDAKVLVLYRDGRDVALSLARAPWMPPDLEVGFMVWLYYKRIVLQAMASRLPGVYFARYEDIVADPERQFGRILDFLGVANEPDVARGHGNTEGVPAREYAWKGAALHKITPDRVGGFRRELTLPQVALLERLGRHTLSASGYPLVTNGVHPLTARCVLRLSWHLAGFLNGLPWNAVFQEWANQLAASL